MGYFIAYEDLYSSWLAKGSDFDVSDVTDALSAFSRLVNPDHKHVFDHIFETLETGLSKLGDTSGARTKAISGLLHLIKDIPMDGRPGIRCAWLHLRISHFQFRRQRRQEGW